MKSNLLKIIVPIVYFLLFFSGRSYYVQNTDGPESGCAAREETEINPKAALAKSLNQIGTKTCYGHAAYYLLQYLYMLNIIQDTKEEVAPSLALFDVFAKGDHCQFNEGGKAFSILQNIRMRSPTIYTDWQLPLREIFELSQKLIDEGGDYDVEGCLTHVLELLGKSVEDVMGEWREIYTQILEQDRSKATYALIEATGNKDKSHTTLPTFNINVFQPQRKDLLAAQESASSMTMELLVQNKMRELLMPIPPHGEIYPVILSFCPKENDDGSCKGNHEAVVTGVRQWCCGSRCHEEWKIVNSYGGWKDGWFKAEDLSISLVKFKRHFTYIRPCAGEDCLPYIQGSFPVHYLIRSKDAALLDELLLNPSLKEKINIRDQRGLTPLAMAITLDSGPAELAILLRHGADINGANKLGKTALHIAIHKGNLQQVKFLLENGAAIDRVDGADISPLMEAVDSGQMQIMQYLVNKGAHLEKADEQFYTPLILAAEKGDLKMVKYLIKKKANIEATTIDNFTPLAQAVFWGRKKVVTYLLKAGADPQSVGSDGRTVLDLAKTPENGIPDPQMVALIESVLAKEEVASPK